MSNMEKVDTAKKSFEGLLVLGLDAETSEMVTLPAKSLKRHIAVFGQSGSGKTVTCKTIVEEAIRNGVPVIAIDPQGDIAAMAVLDDWGAAKRLGIPREIFEEFKKKVEVVIYTPASDKGVPVSINPLILPPKDLETKEKIMAIDTVATNIVSLLKYRKNSNKARMAKVYLYTIFEALVENDILIEDFNMLIDLINNDNVYLDKKSRNVIDEKQKEQLVRDLHYLTIGTPSLVFNYGEKLTVPNMIKPNEKGKTRLAIILLTELQENYTETYISTLAQQIYIYIRSNPSEKPQLLFYIDELAGPPKLIPPYPHNPPTKKWLQLLFKQGRKFGLSMLVATQNIADVDYKAVGQASTYLFGRFSATQDINKIDDMLSAYPDVRYICGELKSFRAGEFYLHSPEHYPRPVHIKIRWPFTRHKTLTIEDVGKLYQNPPENLVKPTNAEIDETLSDLEESLSLAELEKEMKELKEFAAGTSLLDQGIDISSNENIIIEPTSAPEVEIKREEGMELKAKRMDLSKRIVKLGEQYLKIQKLNIKELLTNFFGEESFSFMGTEEEKIVYLPFLLLNYTVEAKRPVSFAVNEKDYNEEVLLDTTFTRLFPLIDKIQLSEDNKMWNLTEIPINPEELFDELLDILPLKSMASLVGSRSSDVPILHAQRNARNLLSTFQEVLLHDETLYKKEWLNAIATTKKELAKKLEKEIKQWKNSLKKQRETLLKGVEEKTKKVKKFQAQIEEAKAIYKLLKPIIEDKFKYKSAADVKKYKSAVEKLKYGPQVINNYAEELKKDVEKIKDIDKKLQREDYIEIKEDLNVLIEDKEFCLPKENEIVEIEGFVLYVPISLLTINVNRKGEKYKLKVIAESVLGTKINVLCEECYKRKLHKVRFIDKPQFCSVCNIPLCDDHAIIGHITGKPLCSEHAVVCSACKNTVSIEHVEYCAFCSKPVCENEIEHCHICSKPICPEHSFKVTKKGLFKSETITVCPEHRSGK